MGGAAREAAVRAVMTWDARAMYCRRKTQNGIHVFMYICILVWWVCRTNSSCVTMNALVIAVHEHAMSMQASKRCLIVTSRFAPWR